MTWLRQQRNFHTTIRPDDRLDGERVGVARVAGYFPRPSSAGRWFYASLCAVSLGALLMLWNLPGMGPSERAASSRAGWAMHAAAAGALVVAETRRRLDRDRALVELRARGAPATHKSVAALARRASGRVVWLVCESGAEPEVLEQANAVGIRCFTASGHRFDEIEPSRRPPTSHRAA